MCTYSTESLIRAMHLPIDDVIHNFQKEQQQFIGGGGGGDGDDDGECHYDGRSDHGEESTSPSPSPPSSSYSWTSERAQSRLAKIITAIVKPRKRTMVVTSHQNKCNGPTSTSNEDNDNTIVGCNDNDNDNDNSNNNNNGKGQDLDVLVFEPAVRYIRKLLQRYASLIEQHPNNDGPSSIENDELVELLMEYQFRNASTTTTTTTTCSRRRTFGSSISGHGMTINDDNIPNPLDSCHVSFIVPKHYDSFYTGNDYNTNYKNNPTYVVNDNDYNYDDHLNNNNNNNIIGIKVYPHHNDVGVRKVWEAGAALAEFLLQRPHLVRGRNVCELGAGVGLTGLVIAGLCQTKTVHLTDYTNATLENLEYNVSINHDWIVHCRESQQRINNVGVEEEEEEEVQGATTTTRSSTNGQIITTGYLEWDDFVHANDDAVVDSFVPSILYKDGKEGVGQTKMFIHQNKSQSLSIASNADVLIAADVIYDRSVVPQLVQVVKTILTSPLTTYTSTSTRSTRVEEERKKIAIFATTFRNAESFALFQSEIEGCSREIHCKFVDSDTLSSMPYIFPCYSVQPRSHVRICIMSAQKRQNE
mmetsp:Transcript_12507/g.18946  ORF Transcript_12507/g.18946 Transcript_12507/m.18946 type:complete len:586 (-) Transcript_12507:127-1884(-)